MNGCACRILDVQCPLSDVEFHQHRSGQPLFVEPGSRRWRWGSLLVAYSRLGAPPPLEGRCVSLFLSIHHGTLQRLPQSRHPFATPDILKVVVARYVLAVVDVEHQRRVNVMAWVAGGGFGAATGMHTPHVPDEGRIERCTKY